MHSNDSIVRIAAAKAILDRPRVLPRLWQGVFGQAPAYL
jgi:hypothetical protein